MFAQAPRYRRRRLVAGLLLLAVIASIVAVVVIRRPARVELHGTFAMAEPLACRKDSPNGILHTEIRFRGPDGTMLGTAIASDGATFRTVTVRGFQHCDESGRYSIRLAKADSYSVEIPRFQDRFGPLSYTRLQAAGFRWDLRP
jgi:hypothetical protein